MASLLVCGLALVPGAAGGAPPRPRSAPVEARRAAPHFRDYVALGDSWTADSGTSRSSTAGPTPSGCRQSVTDYPHQVARALGVARFRDASCRGARTPHLRHRQALPHGQSDAPQFSRLRPTTDLVSLGIGVNDIHLVAAIANCMLHLGLTSCRSKYINGGVDEMSAAIAATRPRMASAIAGIRARSPRAHIILVNYMNGLPADGRACRTRVPISGRDMAWFQQKFLELNAMLARVAHRKRVELVDTYTPTLGHDMCQPPDIRYVEGFMPSNSSGSQVHSVHPNQAGADAQARIVLRAIRN